MFTDIVDASQIASGTLTMDMINKAIQRVMSAPFVGAAPGNASNFTPGARPSPSREEAYYLLTLTKWFKEQGIFDEPHEWYVDEKGELGISVMRYFTKPINQFTIGFRSDGSGIDITP